MTLALESVRRGGRHVQIGLAGKPVSIPFDLVCFGELTVTSGNASTPTSWERALQLIGDRQVDLEPLFSDAVPLAEWEQAFAATRDGAGIKYLLVP
jgi:L-iditol 2-dehydrogenase